MSVGEAAPRIHLVGSALLTQICINPLSVGESAPPTWYRPSRRSRGSRINPLRVGEAAPPGSLVEQAFVVACSVSIPFASGKRRRPTNSRAGSPAKWKKSFNPLRVGEAAPPVDWQEHRFGRIRQCFNPLRVGEAAPPLSKTTAFYSITLSAENSDVSAHKDLRVLQKTATRCEWASISLCGTHLRLTSHVFIFLRATKAPQNC